MSWAPSYELTATESPGQGGFAEMPAGEYQAEFGGSVANCVPTIAWPGAAANQAKVPVKPGFMTIATMICDAR